MLRLIRFRMPIFVIFTGFVLIITACGTRATELRSTFEPTSTFDFTARRIAQGESGVEVVAVQPTNTRVPPTSTPIPPSATPTLESTDQPEPTVEPTDEVETGVSGNPELGEVLFEQVINSTTGHTCKTCHNIDEPVPGLGPYLYGIANVAGTRIEGLSAEEYLRQSITDPRAFLAPPQGGIDEWPDNLMPEDWILYLGDEGVQDVIAYLLTLDQTQ